jgi:hypothetical protein
VPHPRHFQIQDQPRGFQAQRRRIGGIGHHSAQRRHRGEHGIGPRFAADRVRASGGQLRHD